MGLLGNGIQDLLESLIYVLPAVIIALTFHEFGHAYVANLNGDPTARILGRMTLNPFKHIDPLGFLCMMLIGFGWAKPVPVNPKNYRDYKKGELTVSLAGVGMNLLLALFGSVCMSAAIAVCINNGSLALMGGDYRFTSESAVRIYYLLSNFITLNCCLITFNLIPIYPLDGFHVAEVLLSKVIGARVFMFIRKYGKYILIGLIALSYVSGFSILSTVTDAIAGGLEDLAWLIAGLFV